MFEILAIIAIVWFHFIGDFVFQTNKMALNKSKSVVWLTYHALAYSAVFIIISPLYALINGVLHWITDYFTSKISSSYWAKGNMRLFFGTIGLDQAIHFTCLFGTYAAFKHFGMFTLF